ncbi:MAG: toll/interleukin-1 receptor domain-containing protein [Acidobacteriota bacterium]
MSDSGTILKILRRALEAGHTVEIDGLGAFNATEGSDSGGFTFVPESRPQVFVAYVEEDLAKVRKLCDALEAAGCTPWLDKDQLLAGQNWPRAIERAIDISDAFIACCSPRALAKRGQFQSELRYALDCARRMPLEAGFLMPVRLEPCAIPVSIARRVQYVDLFPDWERGVRQLTKAIRKSRKGVPKSYLTGPLA